MNATEILAGKGYLVRITERRRHNPHIGLSRCETRRGDVVDAVYLARITWAEQRDGFVYFGIVPLEGQDRGSFGAERFYDAGPKPFGCQSVELVSTRPAPPERHWYPRPGDRGYDLMC